MVAKSFRLVGICGLLITALTACNTIVTDESSDEPVAVTTKPIEQADPGYEKPTSEPAKPQTPPKVVDTKKQIVNQLQQDALQSQSEGDWTQSELKLERALRILGDDPDLYRQLATVRMGQQRFSEAEQIAKKGLTHANENPKAQAELWHVIAQSRSALGDISGAREARNEASKWSDQVDGLP